MYQAKQVTETQQKVKAFDAVETKIVLTEHGPMPVEEFAKAGGFEWTDSPLIRTDVKNHIAENQRKVEDEQAKDLLIQTFADIGMAVSTDLDVDALLSLLGLPRSRYFQDLPTDEELSEFYNVRPEVIDKVAKANIELTTGYYQHCPVGFFVAKEDLIKGPVGFSYGCAYWARAEYLLGIERLLFNQTGEVIDKKDYLCKFINLQISLKDGQQEIYLSFKISDLKFCLLNNEDLITLNARDKRKIALKPSQLLPCLTQKLSSMEVEVNERNLHKLRFSCSVKLILLNFINEHAYSEVALDQQCLSYVRKLEEDIDKLNYSQSDAIFKIIQSTLRGHEKFFKENLTQLRSEIIKAMKNYNADNEAKAAISTVVKSIHKLNC